MAHNHGGSSTSGAGPMVMMTPWLHVTGGDNLFFERMHPASAGAMAGASILLFLIAVSERYLSYLRAILETRWRQSALIAATKRDSNVPSDTTQSAESCADCEPVAKSTKPIGRVRTAPPFIARIDCARGFIHAFQTLLGVIIMLGVMTFNAAYIVSLVVGAGVGEVAFGRFSAHA